MRFDLASLSFCTSVLILFAGCTLASHRGAYDGSSSPSWVRDEDGGVAIYRPLHLRRNDPSVSFYGIKQGQLYVRINHTSDKPVFFIGEKIKVFVTNAPMAKEYEAKEESTLNVPENGEFEVVVPAFKIGQNTFPELSAHFHWSDRTVWQSKHIFGS